MPRAVPAFHAIMIVRQEADIIAQTLSHLLTWCDTLFVFDTGSTDGTWEIIQDAAARDRRIRLVGHEPVLYSNALRPWVFRQVRHQFRRGDWIARVDADEFYHIPPPRFVQDRVARHEGMICSRMYDFLLSRQDVLAWQRGEENIADRARPIEERRRWFRFDDFPERRIFRYRRGMKWPARHDPLCPGPLARERIPVRHYRARDPVQIQVRCALREPTALCGASLAGWHWKIADWRHFVFADDDPQRHYWTPGTPLPHHPVYNHLPGRRTRWLQRLYHATGMVYLGDRFCRSLPWAFAPVPLSGQMQAAIAHNLSLIQERPYLRDLPEQVRSKRARMSARDVG